MSRYVDIEPLENALKAVEKRGEVAVLLDELLNVIAKYPTAERYNLEDDDTPCQNCGGDDAP